jgi:hypothetical protein
VLGAAERAGWHEAAATTELVLGLCLEERGELDRAREALAHAAEVSDEHGIPAPGWESHAAASRVLRVAGEAAQADEHAAAAEAIVARMAASLNDEALRDRLLERARR